MDKRTIKTKHRPTSKEIEAILNEAAISEPDEVSAFLSECGDDVRFLTQKIEKYGSVKIDD